MRSALRKVGVLLRRIAEPRDGEGHVDVTARRSDGPRIATPGTARADRGRATRTRRASSSATAVRVAYEVYGDGEPTDPVRADRGRSSTRASGRRQIPYFARHVTGSSRSTGAATAARTGRPTRGRTRRAEFAADVVAVMDATGIRARGARRRCRMGAERRCCVAAEHPERVARPGLHRARPSPLGAEPGRTRRVPFEEPLRRRRGLGQVQRATTGGATTDGFLEFFFGEMFTEPHSTKQIEDASAGGTRRTPRRSSPRACAADRLERRDVRRRCLRARIRLPGPGDPRHATTRSPTSSRASASPSDPGARLARSRAAATSPMPATRSGSTCCSATSSRLGIAMTATVALAERTRLMRAVEPAEPGIADVADGVRIAFEVYGAGEPTIVLLPVDADRPLAPVEGPDPLPQPAAPGRHLRRRGNGRSDRPTDPDAYGDERMRRRHRGRHGRDGHRARGARRPVRRRRLARDPARRGRARSGSPGIVAFAVGVPLLAPPHPWQVAVRRSRTSCRPTRAGRSSTATPGGATTRVRSVLLRGDHHGAALDQADRGRRRLGARRIGRRDARRQRGAEFTLDARRRSRRPAAPSAARSSSSTAREDTCQPHRAGAAARRADRRAARDRRGRRPHDPGPPSGPGQPADPRLRPIPRTEGARMTATSARPDLDPLPGTPAARAVHLVADRARTRPARRRRSPTSCASSTRTSRSTGSPSTRSRRARGARRADPPAERGARLGIRPHHGRIVRARPQRVPGHPADGRDPRRQLHGLPRRRRDRRVRPRHRRRGVGRRLLPAREPGAQADGLRLDDRLRRLAADARRAASARRS